MSSPKILISGSGIAGTVLAYWLLRAFPLAHITIIERDASLRLTGASVDIRSSAVDIIKLMNMEPAIRSAATNEAGISWVRKDGSVVGKLEATGREDVQSFTSEYEIFRGELASIFVTPIKDKVNLVFNETVESYIQHDDGVTVKFSNGKEEETYDLLVAADGLGSKIRGKMLNAPPANQIRHSGVHIAYFTMKNDLLNGSLLAQGYNAPGGRMVFIRPDPNPKGQTRVCLLNVNPKTDTVKKPVLDRAMREGNDVYKKLMEREFKGAGWKTESILEAMRDSDDFYASMFGQVRTDVLQDGRVVLVGDAGYLQPGFGTSLAIIGAYVLAGELLRSSREAEERGGAAGSEAGGIDVKLATKRYEELMLPFAKKNQSGEWGDYIMQLAVPQTAMGIRVLHFCVWFFVGVLRVDKILTWLAVFFGKSGEDRLEMPDYGWPEDKLQEGEVKLDK